MLSGYPDHLRPLDFLERAEEFYQAYQDLPQHQYPRIWPRYFLFCHAIELALKAYLLTTGITLKELANKYSHDLEALMNESVNRGLDIGPLAQDLAMLNEVHENYWARYPEPTGKPILMVDTFVSPLKELLEAVSTVIRGGRNQRLWVAY